MDWLDMAQDSDK